ATALRVRPVHPVAMTILPRVNPIRIAHLFLPKIPLLFCVLILVKPVVFLGFPATLRLPDIGGAKQTLAAISRAAQLMRETGEYPLPAVIAAPYSIDHACQC